MISIGAILVEVALALWLMSGIRTAGSLLSAAVLFGMFFCWICISLIRGTSCGCFGHIETDTRITLFTDAFIASAASTAYMLFRRCFKKYNSIEKSFLCMGIAAAAVQVTVVGYNIRNTSVLTPNESPLNINANRIIIYPDQWVGRLCPLPSYIQSGDRLKHGSWLVLLYKHDCQHCAKEIENYREFAQMLNGISGVPSVALVEVPPVGQKVNYPDYIFQSSLDIQHEWIIDTPKGVFISDGIVLGIVIEVDAAHATWQLAEAEI
jgi:hypothetical protein